MASRAGAGLAAVRSRPLPCAGSIFSCAGANLRGGSASIGGRDFFFFSLVLKQLSAVEFHRRFEAAPGSDCAKFASGDRGGGCGGHSRAGGAPRDSAKSILSAVIAPLDPAQIVDQFGLHCAFRIHMTVSITSRPQQRVALGRSELVARLRPAARAGNSPSSGDTLHDFSTKKVASDIRSGVRMGRGRVHQPGRAGAWARGGAAGGQCSKRLF